MTNTVSRVTLRHVKIGRGRFRNFAGKKTDFNKDGKHVVTLFLDDETAAALKDEGWNVRYYTPRSDDDDAPTPIPILDCELRYDNYPPVVKLATGDTETEIDEEDLTNLNLDQADIIDVDVRLSPYSWHNSRGESGIKAYVSMMRIRIEDDF